LGLDWINQNDKLATRIDHLKKESLRRRPSPIIYPVDLIGENQKLNSTTTTLNYTRDLRMERSRELQTVGDIQGLEVVKVIEEKDILQS
jgi:hypothetical protein